MHRTVRAALVVLALIASGPSCASVPGSSEGLALERLGFSGMPINYGNLAVLITSQDRNSGIIIEASRHEVVLSSEWREFPIEDGGLVTVAYVETTKSISSFYRSDALDSTNEIKTLIAASSGTVRIRVFGPQNQYGRPQGSYAAEIQLDGVRIACVANAAHGWTITDALPQIQVDLVPLRHGGSSSP